MTRVLFVGEAVTLAHIVRPLALSRMLDPDRYQVGHAWDPRHDHPPDIPLWTIPARQTARETSARCTPRARRCATRTSRSWCRCGACPTGTDSSAP